MILFNYFDSIAKSVKYHSLRTALTGDRMSREQRKYTLTFWHFAVMPGGHGLDPINHELVSIKCFFVCSRYDR
jgi:hypothetical protein